jgi:hypothetical protein
MSNREETLAFRHAPVLLQKVHPDYMRSDFLTRIDFAYDWPEIFRNWAAPWEKRADGSFQYRLDAHAYYSVVETHTHYFVVYAFYHPQDWTSFWGSPAETKPSQIDQHLHDMEGALAMVPKRKNPEEERAEALLTISHVHFYSFAGWQESNDKPIPVPGQYLITGWTEDVDGHIQATKRFRGDGEPDYRIKLYSASGSHAIKGEQKDWGDEKHIIRYRPSLETAGAPGDDWIFEKDAYFQDVPYKLISIFDADGLWPHLEKPEVFLPNKKGQMTFSAWDDLKNEFVPGSANPPWGWDDCDDRHKPGELAWDPAHLVNDYFNGLREFSSQYIYNPYVGII